MEATALVTALALVEYQVMVMLVGRARGRFGIQAPATAGHPEFERCFAAQRNTIEQLILFIPALWIFSYYVHAWTAVGLGLVFIAGRALYFHAYVRDPARRAPGFVLSMLATTILVLGALVGPALRLL